ncbi:hypothetical protein, partial [Arenibacter certesii]|uniref:hypothetical protein n=1 Tax=Arenibacter certesii TaxID=228955 RepID=UPI000556C36B
KDKGQDQGHRDLMDILRHPYRQRTGDRQGGVGHGAGKSGIGTSDPKLRWERYARTSLKRPKSPLKPDENPLRK